MSAGPYTRFVLWRATRIWLRDPRRALARLAGSAERLDGPRLALRAWLALTYQRDPATAASNKSSST